MGRTVRGFCPLDCADTCAWSVEVDDEGRAVALRPDKEHPITAGALCGKVNRYLDALHGPDRLLYPMRRVGPKGSRELVRISWDEAIERVAAGLRSAIDEAGPESVLPYYYAGTMGLVQGWTLGPRLFRHLGASRLQTTICSAAYSAASKHTLGASVGYDPEDLVHARLVLLWGANPLNAAMHQWKFVAEAKARGAHVVAIDPIRSDSAARCDEHVAPLPGTDGALALGLMRHVLDVGAEDRAWPDAHTVGWPELEARLADWPVERAAAVCGLDVGVVRALGDRLAQTRPTAIRIGLGLQRHGGAAAEVAPVAGHGGDRQDRPAGGALGSTAMVDPSPPAGRSSRSPP
jgi:anaerobic selenocysteine-containing dehydrogenase